MLSTASSSQLFHDLEPHGGYFRRVYTAVEKAKIDNTQINHRLLSRLVTAAGLVVDPAVVEILCTETLPAAQQYPHSGCHINTSLSDKSIQKRSRVHGATHAEECFRQVQTKCQWMMPASHRV